MGYEIQFWREVTNSHGHPFRVVLARFATEEAPPGQETIDEATAVFCRMMRVDRWGIVAHGYDVADIDGRPGADELRCMERPSAPPARGEVVSFPAAAWKGQADPWKDVS